MWWRKPVTRKLAGNSNLESVNWTPPASLGGTNSSGIEGKPRSDSFAKAEQRFRSELPRLLNQSDKIGKWVLYSEDGIVAERADEASCYEQYGSKIGEEYFLGHVHPDAPQAEVTPSWFVSVDRGPAPDDPRSGR